MICCDGFIPETSGYRSVYGDRAASASEGLVGWHKRPSLEYQPLRRVESLEQLFKVRIVDAVGWRLPGCACCTTHVCRLQLRACPNLLPMSEILVTASGAVFLHVLLRALARHNSRVLPTLSQALNLVVDKSSELRSLAAASFTLLHDVVDSDPPRFVNGGSRGAPGCELGPHTRLAG